MDSSFSLCLLPKARQSNESSQNCKSHFKGHGGIGGHKDQDSPRSHRDTENSLDFFDRLGIAPYSLVIAIVCPRTDYRY